MEMDYNLKNMHIVNTIFAEIVNTSDLSFIGID